MKRFDEFERVRDGRVDAWVRRDRRAALETAGLLGSGFTLPDSKARFRGRGNVFSIELPGGRGVRAVVRFYRHGGLSGVLFGGWFAGPSRAERELRIALGAATKGVPTVRPLAAVTYRTLGLFYRALLVTEEVEGASDLVAFVEDTASDPDRAGDRRAASRAVAHAVRRMHDAGFVHADLNLKNVLVAPGPDGLEARILDWDLSRDTGAPLSRRARLRNLMRMDRSARKFASRGTVVPLKERLRFLKHYFLPGNILPPSRRELEAWAMASYVHRIAWILQGRKG